MRRRFGFGRALLALALLAGLATTMAVAAPAAAATTTVTIHKAKCSTDVDTSYFDACHNNRQSGIGFTIGGTARVTNGSGVAAAAVTPGKVTITETSALSDGGQFIYCSVPDTGRVLFGDHRTGGSITVKVKSGEHVVCDWFNLYKPKPKGIVVRIHAFWCPNNVSGDIFTACHKTANAKKSVLFSAKADAGKVSTTTNSSGKLSLSVPTASTGWVWVQIEEDPSAVTQHGAFVYCSSDNSEPGSGDVLGGVTVYDGVVNVQVKDGTKFTCDWYNLTP